MNLIIEEIIQALEERYPICNTVSSKSHIQLYVIDTNPRWIRIEERRKHIWLDFVVEKDAFEESELADRIALHVKIHKLFGSSDRVKIRVEQGEDLRGRKVWDVFDDLFRAYLQYRGLDRKRFPIRQDLETELTYSAESIRWFKQVGTGSFDGTLGR